jgi:hypothetical protein
MNKDWEKILTTKLPHQAELAKAKLAEQDIDAVIINKQSSAYPTLFGMHEVYVPTRVAIVARLIIEHETTNS